MGWLDGKECCACKSQSFWGSAKCDCKCCCCCEGKSSASWSGSSKCECDSQGIIETRQFWTQVVR